MPFARLKPSGPCMVAYASLLPELEEAIARGSAERRAETLERITQLFLHGADQLSEEQVGLFDEVFGRLIHEIEQRALAELAQVLAPVAKAPRGVVRQLANHDDIAIAGPVLQQSPRLDDDDLVAIARAKSQAHLLAISGRSEIDTTVTDVLVRRGDRDVVLNLAGNAAAHLSETGYAALVKRASQDGMLAERVGGRGDIPLPLFHRLVAQATAVVQERLMAGASPERQAEIKRVLAKVADEVGVPARRDYRAAQQCVAALKTAGTLNEAAVIAAAKAGEFELTVATLAMLCGVPLDAVDRLVDSGKPDPILILCRGAQLGWPTAEAVLLLWHKVGGPAMEGALAQFERLSPSTAQRILHFWRARPDAQATG